MRKRPYVEPDMLRSKNILKKLQEHQIEMITCISFQLDLLLKDSNGGDTTSFVKNGEWDLIGWISVFLER